MPSPRDLLPWAERTLGEDVTRRVFEPLVADWTFERAQALTPWRRRVVAARWSWAMVATVAWATRTLPAPGWRAARAMGLFTLAGTIALIVPFAKMAFTPALTWHTVAYLAPQALGLAVPFSVLPVALILGASATSKSAGQRRKQLGMWVAVVMCVTAINVAVIVPEANQAFRSKVRAARSLDARPPRRGARELGIVDLVRARGVEPATAQRELRAKAAFVLVWPLALAALGWRLGRHRQSAPATALLFWWLAAVAIAAVNEPARQTAYLRDWPELVVALSWCVAATAARPRVAHLEDVGATR